MRRYRRLAATDRHAESEKALDAGARANLLRLG